MGSPTPFLQSPDRPMAGTGVVCTRCGMTLGGGLSSHRRACLRVPRPKELAEIFLTGQFASTEALALYYGVSTGFVESRLEIGGVRREMIDETREWTTHAVKPCSYDRCELCDIYVIPDGVAMPHKKWSRRTSGMVVTEYTEWRSKKKRRGILCYGCANGL